MEIGTIPRGEDFADKFARGEWAETVLLETIDRRDGVVAFQYGVSRGEALETESELDAVKEPGVEDTKRPDVLVFREDTVRELDETVRETMGEYVAADADGRAALLPALERAGVPGAAELAIEAESSAFHVGRREYESSLSAYVKDEDFRRLRSWRERHNVPILVCQLFFDRAYAVPFSAYERYADDARNGSASVPGFDHGEIPVIRKPALRATVETFPRSERLGEFVDSPSVVERTGFGTEEREFGWSRSGRLDAGTSAFFSGGTLELERPLADYL